MKRFFSVKMLQPTEPKPTEPKKPSHVRNKSGNQEAVSHVRKKSEAAADDKDEDMISKMEKQVGVGDSVLFGDDVVAVQR